MTREEAIEWMQEEKARFELAPDLNGCPMTEDWQKAIDVYDMAISALRQQETVAKCNGLIGPVEYGCEYCNDPHPARDCVVDGNLEQMLVGRSFYDAYVHTRRIKFCPMCGRKLLEEGTV